MFRPWKGVLSLGLVLAVLPAAPAMAQDAAPPDLRRDACRGCAVTQGQPVIASYTCSDYVAVATLRRSRPQRRRDQHGHRRELRLHGRRDRLSGGGATVTRHYSVVPVTGTPVGETPATLSLTLGRPRPSRRSSRASRRDTPAMLTASPRRRRDATLSVADPTRRPPDAWSTARSASPPHCRSRRPARTASARPRLRSAARPPRP